ncbi:hypothetical protein ACLOJK_025147 [Asimina triloba]
MPVLLTSHISRIPASHSTMTSSCIDKLYVSASRNPKPAGAASSFRVHLARTLQVLPPSQSQSPDEPLFARTQPVQVMTFPSVGYFDLLLPHKLESLLKAMTSYFNLPHHLLLPYKHHILYLTYIMNDPDHDLTFVLRMDVTTRKRIQTDDRAIMLRLKKKLLENIGAMSPEAAAAVSRLSMRV